MITCRLLCALLVLALCCCSSVCVTEVSLNRHFFPDDHDDDHNKTTNHDHDHYDKTTNPRPPPLQHRHQALRLQSASCVDHPRTVTSSRNRRQPQQLCVGVCPAGARRIRAGVHPVA
ncbi:mucin, putative, partial [Trypanosoma cruzi]